MYLTVHQAGSGKVVTYRRWLVMMASSYFSLGGLIFKDIQLRSWLLNKTKEHNRSDGLCVSDKGH